MMKDEASTGLSGCSDADLMAGARAGGHAPLAELWRRHHRAGVLAARRCTSSLDPDDLVSEAFARIIRALRAGGGPRDAFRPYLYATIRNVAARWASTERSVTIEDWAEVEQPEQLDDPAVRALERTLTARAFRSLPDRWQTVLWYTEVEGLDPHEVAPLLGLSPNAVAALAYRARDALRTAWLQAHIADSRTPPDCAWSVARLGEHARGHLPPTQSRRMSEHLASCTRCGILAEELDDLASRAALVLVPLLLGATAAGASPATIGGPDAVLAASAPAVPAPMVPVLPMPVAAGAAAGAAVSHGAAMLVAPAVLAIVLALGVPSSAADRPIVDDDGATASIDGGGAALPAEVAATGGSSGRKADGDASSDPGEPGPGSSGSRDGESAEAGSSAVEGVVDGAVDGATGAVDGATGAVDDATGAIGDVTGTVPDPTEALDGVTDTVTDSTKTIGDTADQLVGGAIDGGAGIDPGLGSKPLDIVDELESSIPPPTTGKLLG